MILLATWLWQGMAIACATGVVVSRRRWFGAATRHALWWMALVAVALLPLAPVLSGFATSSSAALVPDLPPAAAAVPLPAAPEAMLAVLAVVWLAVTVWSLARIALSLRALKRLKAESMPLDPARAAALPMWNALGATRRLPQLRVSNDVRAAAALGLGRPVILLSPAVLALGDESLDAIVMHEHAHLARYDDWTQLAQALVGAVLALHPAAWFIGRHIRLEREAACDDAVVARGATASAYARSLVELADATRFDARAAAAIPGATRSRSELHHRVRRLLDASRPRELRLAVPAVAGCALALILAVGLAAKTPGLVVFVESDVPSPPVAALARAFTRSARLLPLPSASVAPVRAAAQTALPGGARDVPPQSAPKQTAPPPPLVSVPFPAAPAAANGPVDAPLATVPVSARAVETDLELASIPASAAPALTASPPSGWANPWMGIARSATSAGKATGSGAKTAGTSIGRFFRRAGKAIAGGS